MFEARITSKDKESRIFKSTLFETINYIDDLEDVIKVSVYENNINVLLMITSKEGRRWFTV